MLSVEARDLSKCAFPDAVSADYNLSLFDIQNQRFFPTIKRSFHCRFLYHKRSKKSSRNPAHKMSLSAAMEFYEQENSGSRGPPPTMGPGAGAILVDDKN